MQYLDQFGVAKLTGTGACVFIEVTDDMNNRHSENAPCKSYLVNSLQESPLRHFKGSIGYRQVVRHRVLISASVGSNPATPAIIHL